MPLKPRGVAMQLHPQAGRLRPVIGWMIAGLVLAVAAGGAVMARKSGHSAVPKKASAKESAPAAPVELTQVRRGALSTYLQTTAALEARHAAVLVARRQGQVVRLLAEEGAWVEQGGVLARLDDREAQLAVERAELGAEVARREVERGQQLSQKGYMSPKELDDLELRTRNANVELEQARYELSQRKITAPFAGRVVERMVQLGETVTAGKEAFRIVDFNPVLARVYFPERELSRVHVGQEAEVTLDTHPGEKFVARATLVNPVVDRSTGTFKVTLEIPNPSGTLRPGTFARVRLETGHFDGTMLLPRRGILSEDGEDYVFVARGDSAVRVAVKLGAVEGDTAQILAGLGDRDRVVTVGQGGLKPGAKIKPVSL